MDYPKLIRSSDLALTGEDPRTLAKLSQAGTLKRIRQGVYVNTAEWTTLSRYAQYGLRADAFAHLAGTEPVFTYATAALLWGLWIVGTPAMLHVRISPVAGGRNRNNVKRRAGRPSDVMVRCGQYVITDKLTTTIQLISKLTFPYAVAVCDSSLRPIDSRAQVNTFLAPNAAATRNATWDTDSPQGQPLSKENLIAAAVLLPSKAARDRALTVINFASHLSGSAGESISRAKMHLLGFPAPVLQKEYRLRDGSRAKVDFWFEELDLAGEFDGKEKYLRAGWGGGSMEDRLWKEKQREDSIRSQGVRFLRWTWADLQDSRRFEMLLRNAGLPQSNTRRKNDPGPAL